MPNTLFTIGHSTRTLDELIAMLKAHRIVMLVDVRTVPRSRTNPQFNRETLPKDLASHGIGYRHEPALGGLRHPRGDSINTAWKNANFRGYADHMLTPEFSVALDAILYEAQTQRIAIMCAEAVPWRCHRSLIADALTARKLAVEHIMSAGPARPHRTTAFAQVEGSIVTYPGLLR